MAINCPHCDQSVEGFVPEERLSKIVEQRKRAQLDLTEALAALDDAKTGLSDAQKIAGRSEALQAQVEQLTTDVAAANGRYDTFSTIASAGITDPELVAATEWAYSRLAADDRPAMGEWLTAIQADPSTAPVVLRPHLASPASGEAPAPPPPSNGAPNGVQAPAPVNTPPANSGALPYSGAPSQFSAQQIANMTDAEYAANSAAIRATLGRS